MIERLIWSEGKKLAYGFQAIEKLELELVSGCNGSVWFNIKGWARDNKTSKPNIKVTFESGEYPEDFQIIDATELRKDEHIRPLIKVLGDKKNPSIFD